MLGKFAFAARVLIALCFAVPAAWAQDGGWVVQKSSGEIWVTSPGAQQVALSSSAALKAGDQIRTGGSGRVLLVRGDEKILVSPNSVIGLPKEPSAGLTTTILQESGSILLEVEKRSQKHFEVETPYLVAVVKGTEFRVTVEGRESRVDVLSGQVEVAELATGKYALVMPGQAARVGSGGAGLTLSGPGATDSIKQGTPRAPRANPGALLREARANGEVGGRGNSAQALRIKSAIGEVRLDFEKVTKGIARSASASLDNGARSNGRAESRSEDRGRSDGSNGLGNGAAKGLGNGGGNGGGNGLGNGGGNGNGARNGSVASSGVGNGLGGTLGKGACNGKGKGKGSSC